MSINEGGIKALVTLYTAYTILIDLYCLCMRAIKSKKMLNPLNGKYLSGSPSPSLFTDLGGGGTYYFYSSGYLMLLTFENGVTAVPASLKDLTDLTLGGGSAFMGDGSI